VSDIVDDRSAVEAEFSTKLEALVPGVHATGVAGTGPVDVVAVRWIGGNYIELTYRDEHDDIGQAVLGRDHEPRIGLESAGRTRAFDSDADAWRLAAEALRIRYAALFDPMLAVTTSDLEALPHQIQAVYGELLPRSPLRFLLADDPGAGKTIMCGLYIKELMLRGDLARCLIVAPGSLVDQWQDELLEKFGISFEVLTRSQIDATALGTNVFDQHSQVIVRMDQLSRNEDLLASLERSDWDLVVVDEAHRMSAHYFGNELKTTKRYQLGQLLGRITRHLLLMTATPHSGKQEDFQLFMALLDGDRFEGKFRDGVHSISPGDLMRRMVKEELLTMEGKPLFPERRAYTVPYELSEGEVDLYEAVSQYVRDEMNRADRLKAEGEGRRGNTIGFALTVLQRRLASSPEAILRSLERRSARLEKRRREMDLSAALRGDDLPLRARLNELLGHDVEDIDDTLDDLAGDELEELEEDVMDAATAARTIAELGAEIAILGDLTELARRVRHSGTDRKWSELRSILVDNALSPDEAGNPRKIIIFTEHRDTLNYLVEQIGTLIGDPAAIVAIHGGVRREERRKAQELFTQDRRVRILVATDAAGEGINLQRAHLMVNYDLPWNPNRLEQRFGRIHRIGQTEVCHLWNLVAANTREGEVFKRLLEKIEQQRAAYSGKVFDVLGDAFDEQPLRNLLIEAIRYGDQPAVRAKLDIVIDETVSVGINKLIAERALHREVLAEADVEAMRRRLEDAQASRLQPHYIRAFFLAAFGRLGGRIVAREDGRYEITHVPTTIRDRDRQIGTGAAVLSRYERVCFERAHVRVVGSTPAHLIAPGHPVLDAVVDLTIEQNGSTLKHGTIMVDPADTSETPRLLVVMSQKISDGHSPARVISKRFDFSELTPSGDARAAGPAPYLDYEALPQDARHAIDAMLDDSWLARGVENIALEWAIEHTVAEHRHEVEGRVLPSVERTRQEVRQRLVSEINFWDGQHAALLDKESAGHKLRLRPETAYKRARDMERRLEQRLADLDADERLTVHPPLIAGAALVVPQGLLNRLAGPPDAEVAAFAKDTAIVERRAVDAVLATERELGRTPHEMPHYNPGYDVRSVEPSGVVIRIEVKGRISGADDFIITRNEVLTAKNLGDDYRLALVDVSPDGPHADRVCYLTRPFDHTGTDDFRVTRFTLNWAKTWGQGGPPQ
jgi:superfamily II DNA or RNA helicase